MSRPAPPPEFIAAREVAIHLRVTTKSLSRMVANLAMPTPWVRVGERSRLWRRKHWDEFVAKGQWPEEAWKGPRTVR